MKLGELNPGDLFKINLAGDIVELQVMECATFKGEYVFARKTVINSHKLFVLFPTDEVALVQKWRDAERKMFENERPASS